MSSRMQGLLSLLSILLLGMLSACSQIPHEKTKVPYEPLQEQHANLKVQPEPEEKPAKEVVSQCEVLNYYETLRLMSTNELELGLIALRESVSYTEDNCSLLRLAMLLGLPEFRLKNDVEAEKLLNGFLQNGDIAYIDDRQITRWLLDEIYWRKGNQSDQKLLKNQIEAEQARSFDLQKHLEKAQSKLEQLQNIDKNINAREQEISEPLMDKILHESK